MSAADAEAMERYRRVRERGAQGPLMLHGSRMRAKAARGYDGPRFRAFYLGAGLLFCAIGIALLAGALLLDDPGIWRASPLRAGVCASGLGIVTLLGHPLRVLQARRRWRSWLPKITVPEKPPPLIDRSEGR